MSRWAVEHFSAGRQASPKVTTFRTRPLADPKARRGMTGKTGISVKRSAILPVRGKLRRALPPGRVRRPPRRGRRRHRIKTTSSPHNEARLKPAVSRSRMPAVSCAPHDRPPAPGLCILTVGGIRGSRLQGGAQTQAISIGLPIMRPKSLNGRPTSTTSRLCVPTQASIKRAFARKR